MNIQQLRYVVATAEQGSMTAAARSLFVAQPALSRAIRSLERELGVILFERAGRGLALTAEGTAFVARARRALRSLDALRRQGGDGPAGHAPDRPRDEPLTVAASPTLQMSLALPILAALRDQGVVVTTRLLGCGSNREVHALVGSGTADIGLCDHAVDSDLDVVPLGDAEVGLVSPAGLDLPPTVPLALLADIPLVLPTPGSDRRASLDWFFDAIGVVPVVTVESDERSVWLESVRRGLASCIWHSVDLLRLPTDEVVVRRFDPPLHQQLTAVHRGSNDAPAKVHLLEAISQLAALRSAAADAGPGAGPVSLAAAPLPR